MKTLRERKKLKVILIIVGMLILGWLFTNKIKADAVTCDICGRPMSLTNEKTSTQHKYNCVRCNIGKYEDHSGNPCAVCKYCEHTGGNHNNTGICTICGERYLDHISKKSDILYKELANQSLCIRSTEI